MNKKVRIVAITITLALMLTIVIGWGEGKVLAAESRVIVDQLGRVVKIPKDVERIVSVCKPIPSLVYAVDGSGDKIIGMHPSAMVAVKNSILRVMAPELLNASTRFVKGKSEVNIEELLKLKPDVVFQWAWMEKEIEKMEAVGIPVIALYGGGPDPRNVEGWLEIIGEVLKKESRVTELLSYHHETLGMISYRIYKIPREDRPKALYMFKVESLTVRRYFWMELTGATNVAGDISSPGLTHSALMRSFQTNVNMEQILAWNPDIIYIGNFCETQPEEILENKIEGQDWSKVEAVRNGRIYKLPLGLYRWDPPSTDSALILKWLAQKHHPKLFDDYTIEEEIKNFYSRFYYCDLSDEEVRKILHPRKGIW